MLVNTSYKLNVNIYTNFTFGRKAKVKAVQ